MHEHERPSSAEKKTKLIRDHYYPWSYVSYLCSGKTPNWNWLLSRSINFSRQHEYLFKGTNDSLKDNLKCSLLLLKEKTIFMAWRAMNFLSLAAKVEAKKVSL